MTDLAERAARIAEEARAAVPAKREANRARWPKFAAFVDDLRTMDPNLKVTKVYPEFCE